MQVFVYITFIIFVVILTIIGFYFSFAIVYRRYNKKMIDYASKNNYAQIYNIMNDNDKYLGDTIIKMKRDFKSKRGSQAFYEAFKLYVDEYGLSISLMALVDEVVDYKAILKNNLVKNTYGIGYALNLVSEFQLDNKEIKRFAIDNLDSDSLYVRNNALRALQNQKDTSCILVALDKVNNLKKLYNYKVVVDVLDNFKGPKDILNRELINRLDSFNPGLQGIIVDHLINVRNSDKIVVDKMLELLEFSSEKEVITRVTRYFSHIENLKAKPLILKNLLNEDWNIRAVSASAISSYSGDDIVEMLKNRIKDVNYYVRKNSANTLIQMIDKDELFRLTHNNPDNFAAEILEYSMEVANIKGYSEYKQKQEAGKNIWVLM